MNKAVVRIVSGPIKLDRLRASGILSRTTCRGNLPHLPSSLRLNRLAMSSRTVHNVAKTGFGTGTNELYDKARPSYPPQAIQSLYEQVRSKTPSPETPLNILEIGSGTGIFTRALLSSPSFSSSIAELRAVEPSEGMRATFDANTKDPRVRTYEGTFDGTGVEDGWADLIVVAQAFHWCPDYNAAMLEFARALKPTGIAAFIWNLEDSSSTPWVAQLRDTYEQFEQGTPQYRLGLWRATFSTPAYTSSFIPPSTLEFSRFIEGTEESVVNRVLSKSYIAVLPEDEKRGVVERVREIVRKGEGRKWIDEEKGVFEYPYRTTLVIMKRA